MGGLRYIVKKPDVTGTCRILYLKTIGCMLFSSTHEAKLTTYWVTK